ncbi:transcriptional regulator BetI [Atopomonas sediminilitoris]|uniref:transcriptional regulator BetI n=1 Tax=Atopomonas sediminilitoris TaxID=2919919 RepID=UPI001F4DB358|nr:transcriptional regulator BetI [Atopomonas sediminilitoris]MCJ8169548.1 transcriptional regulator BetI [Atopomonas sediminilitoris]
MPKVGMQPVRRRQLIEATLSSIDQHGLHNTTIVTISRLAGVSSGIISHYFGGKNGLLEASMRHLLKELGNAYQARAALVDRDDGQARVMAVVDANFDRVQTSPAACKTWLAFWAEAMHQPELARLQRVNAKRLLSHLRGALRTLLPAPRAQLAAQGLAALIDGIWLRGALEGGIDTAQAKALCRDYLQQQLRYKDS